MPQGDRLQISLARGARSALRSRFSRSEREIFIALDAREAARLERLRTARTRAHFLLQLGYFRARQRFFALDRDAVAEDLAYVREVRLDGAPVPDLEVSKHTCSDGRDDDDWDDDRDDERTICSTPTNETLHEHNG